MVTDIAIAIIHGAGIHHPETNESMEKMKDRLTDSFKAKVSHVSLNFEVIYWDDIAELQTRQDDLRRTLEKAGVNFNGLLDFNAVFRKYVFDLVGDVAAYQPVNDPNLKADSTYNIVHNVITEALLKLSLTAGGAAPLCIIAHSLGTVIASNYIYDLRKHRIEENTPLENGDTLKCLFTMGSPMALWGLRTGKLDKPIAIPHWINFYDNSDPIAYPLEDLFKEFGGKIVQDMRVETGITPLAHFGYWENETVINTIVDHLVDLTKPDSSP